MTASAFFSTDFIFVELTMFSLLILKKCDFQITFSLFRAQHYCTVDGHAFSSQILYIHI